MKLAILSDPHGNDTGLLRCLREIDESGADRLICLGDYYGYGDHGDRVLDELAGRNALCLMGNHEAMLLGILPLDPERNLAYRLHPEELTEGRKHFLSAMTPNRELFIGGKRLLFCHGNPTDPICGYLYEDKLTDDLEKLSYDAVFMGHTHRPYMRRMGKVLLVNCGSCGLPRDVGNRLTYALYDTDTGNCELKEIHMEEPALYESFQKAHESVLACLRRR